MSKRKIITIDDKRCTGCGVCIPNCPEGALQIIDGKARLISDLFCDGLGACIGHCPEGAITTEERVADAYDENKVMVNIIAQGKNVIRAHLQHLKEHNQETYLQQAVGFLKDHNIENPLSQHEGHAHAAGFSGCPGSREMDFRDKKNPAAQHKDAVSIPSQLRQWPVQIMLVNTFASFFNGADVLIAADCVPFAYADFHQDLLKDKVLLVGCPKLDDIQVYQRRLSEIFTGNTVKSITYAHMEVPCCFGLVPIITQAIKDSGKQIPFKDITISIQGEKKTQ